MARTQYNTALTIFFIPYVVFEIFGLVTVCQGPIQNWSGLLATRFFLGLAATGMFPGSFCLIGMWYERSEA